VLEGFVAEESKPPPERPSNAAGRYNRGMGGGDDVRLLALESGLGLGEPAEAALEDYARVLLEARAVEVVHEHGLVTGLRVTGRATPVPARLAEDVRGFARGLVSDRNSGLGWS
jgi:hypothetical protein